jgi:hypothetical protein
VNVLERIVAAIALGLLKWLEGRLEQQNRAVDAETDPALLRRAGDRVREWMRKDGPREREQSDQDRPVN